MILRLQLAAVALLALSLRAAAFDATYNVVAAFDDWFFRPHAATGDTNLVVRLYAQGAAGMTLDGTNIVSWTDSVGGIVAAATSAARRASYDATLAGGRGMVRFTGAQAFDLSAAISATNSTVLVVAWRASTEHQLTYLSRTDATSGGPYFTTGNGSTYVHTGVGNSRAYAPNPTGMVFVAYTPNSATNHSVISRGTAFIPTTYYVQTSAGTAYTRLGARGNDLWSTGAVGEYRVYSPPLSIAATAAKLAELIADWE